jgi:hypothetical protein
MLTVFGVGCVGFHINAGMVEKFSLLMGNE